MERIVEVIWTSGASADLQRTFDWLETMEPPSGEPFLEAPSAVVGWRHSFDFDNFQIGNQNSSVASRDLKLRPALGHAPALILKETRAKRKAPAGAGRLG